MEDFIIAVSVGLIVLSVLAGKIWGILGFKLEKKGKKVYDTMENVFTGFIAIAILCSIILMGLVLANEIFKEKSPQTIIIMNHSGEVIAEYENSNKDLFYKYGNGKIEITSGDEKYLYLNVTAEIEMKETKPLW